MKKKIIYSLFLLGLLSLFVLPIFAFAQTQFTISTGIPGVNANSSTSSPGAFVANFYQFALIIGGVLAFGVIVYGGIKYMTSPGNPSGQSDGKEWIEAALLGLILLAGAYFILSVVNPQLLNLNLPGLAGANVNLSTITVPGSGGTGTGSAPSGGSCAAPKGGPCTVANLQQTCLASQASTFAGICGHESGGAPTIKSGTDYCTGPNGEKESVSIGLFQVNLTNSWKQTVDGQSCGNAFQGQAIHCSGKAPCTSSSGASCQVTNMSLYADCVKAAQDVNNNINVACQLNSGGNLGPWKGDAKVCGF